MRTRGSLRIRSAVATCALVVALAGCGGSDEPARTTGAAADGTQRAQFIASADAICTQGRARFDPLQTRLTNIQKESTGNDAEDFAKASAVVAELIAVSDSYVARLVALTPPAQMKAPVARWLGLQTRIVSLLRQAKLAADGRDSPGFKAAFAQINQVGVQRNAAAVAVGFKVCGRI
jgi:hypothetical protein